MSTTKRRALILISSARQLPLAEPADVESISTGFFLVEMAQVLKEFENDYAFTFATPDGQAPQLDINGMALSMQAIEKTGMITFPLRLQQRGRSFDVNSFRQRHPELVARREQEVQLLERHIGRIPVSELLPNSEPELAAYRPELIRRLDKLPEGTFHSLQELVLRHRDPADPFTFADFDFIHTPGGHAPMVDFHDNPFLAAAISTVPAIGELFALRFLYPRVPGKKTRLSYFVDKAIKEAGFKLATSLNMAAPLLAYEPAVRLLTGNGPQAIDQQAARLRAILADTPAHQQQAAE